MTTFLQYGLLGLGVGAGIALLALGVAVVQTGSGVINFAHAAMATVAAFVFSDLWQVSGWPLGVALGAAVIGGAVLGAFVYQVVIRPIRSTPGVVMLVATVGVLVALTAVAALRWGSQPRVVPFFLPLDQVQLPAGLTIGADRLIMLGIAVSLTAVLWAGLRFSSVGAAVRGSAESERTIAGLGWSPHLLGTLTWMVGGALAALAGILLAPITQLQAENGSLLIIPALAGALIGSFSNLWLALLGALLIGIGQSEVANYATTPGLETAVPLVLIFGFLLVRGRSLPTRETLMSVRLPAVGTGRVDKRVLIIAIGVFVVLTYVVFPVSLVNALSVSLAWAVILLSLVVVLGYTGQLNLAPLAWGGVGALITARLVQSGMAFAPAFLIGVLSAVPSGVLCGIPALRARGLNLAVITLAIGVAMQGMVFNNGSLTGSGITGDTQIGAQHFLGLNIDPAVHPTSYMLLTFGFFVALALSVASVRRGRAGRRLLAVRMNERAAAALGVSPLWAKLYAFVLSTVIASVGGILLAFHSEAIDFTTVFHPIVGLQAAVFAVVGGVGFVIGPLLGMLLAAGGFGSWLLDQFFSNPNAAILSLISGVAVVVILFQDPDGQAALLVKQGRWVASRITSAGRSSLARTTGDRTLPAGATPNGAQRRGLFDSAAGDHERKSLVVEGLTVRYGGVVAVSDVSLTVKPGRVLGLIGPNGAGKTSLIDAITGFTPLAEGGVRLEDERIDRWKANRRARAGVARAFQSLELFESSTVRENLLVASDDQRVRTYLSDLAFAKKEELPPIALAALHEFELTDYLDDVVSSIPYGARRLTAIARAIATSPSVLLLDEPAAGLGTPERQRLGRVVRGLVDHWGIGVLVVEHDMEFVTKHCDDVTVLDFGRQIASGTPRQIEQDPVVIAAYLGEQDEAVGTGTARVWS
jgi:sulfate-transporting ATPase